MAMSSKSELMLQGKSRSFEPRFIPRGSLAVQDLGWPTQSKRSQNQSIQRIEKQRPGPVSPLHRSFFVVTATPKLDSGARCRQSERNLCWEEFNARVPGGTLFLIGSKSKCILRLHFSKPLVQLCSVNCY